MSFAEVAVPLQSEQIAFSGKHFSYRPDIDGLRAISVIAVIIFHAFPPLLKGGFVGVDVFFVISGFLITRLIADGLEKDSFSFADFYARRIRRIFPALLIVLVTTFAIGWVILLPGEFRLVSKHLVGAAGFFLNFMTAMTASQYREGGMTSEERMVIFASSLGTVFEWYDFYIYGTLAPILAAQFFSGVNPTAAFIFTLLAFAAGFAVRPFGALFFGRLGDLVGRKYTFIITMTLMGVGTFFIGLLPSYASVGIIAPIILIGLRLAQGLALGGEYGGAAIYVCEHGGTARRHLQPNC